MIRPMLIAVVFFFVRARRSDGVFHVLKVIFLQKFC